MNSLKNYFLPIASPLRGEIKRGASVLFIFSIILLAACSNTNPEVKGNFIIKGKLINTNGETIYFEKMAHDGIKKIDSVKIVFK